MVGPWLTDPPQEDRSNNNNNNNNNNVKVAAATMAIAGRRISQQENNSDNNNKKVETPTAIIIDVVIMSMPLARNTTSCCCGCLDLYELLHKSQFVWINDDDNSDADDDSWQSCISSSPSYVVSFSFWSVDVSMGEITVMTASATRTTVYGAFNGAAVMVVRRGHGRLISRCRWWSIGCDTFST